GLALRLWSRARPAPGDAGRLRDLRQGQSRTAGAPVAERLRRRAEARRYVVVLPPLLVPVRRVRRARELFERVLSQPVRALDDRGGEVRDALRRRGFGDP